MERQSPNLLEQLRQKFFGALANFVDKGYRYVRIKPDLTIQEANYLRSYEDIFLLEFIGITATFISTYYLFAIYKYRHNMPNLPKFTAVKGATFFAMGIASTISAYMIESKEKIFDKTEHYSKQFEEVLRQTQWQQMNINNI